MYLFVKSIKFCDDRRRVTDPPNCRDSVEDALDYASKANEYYKRKIQDLSQADLATIEEYLRRIQLARMAIRNAFHHHEPDPTGSLARAEQDLLHAYTLAGSDPSQGDVVTGLIEGAIGGLRVALNSRANAPSACERLSMTRIHVNNPDDAVAMKDFKDLVNCLADHQTDTGGDVDMKALMVLDPLGNPTPFGETVSVQTPVSSPPGSAAPPSAQTGNQTTPPPPAGPADLTAPTAPVVHVKPDGCTAGTPVPYWVGVTYVKGTNESLISKESGIKLPSDCTLYVDHPADSGKGATHYNIYVGTTTGTPSKQTAMPVALSDD
jgi:hypothetical protein